MIEHNQQIKEIVRLLWSGDTAEAKRLIAVESANLEPQVTELKDKLTGLESDLATLRSLAPSADDQKSLKEAGLSAIQATEGRKPNPAQKRRRKREILKAAAEVSANGQEFTSDEIGDILLKSGVVIGIPENRLNTAIGAVLRRRDDYELLARGLYRKRKVESDYREPR